jgi:hypothetical protein
MSGVNHDVALLELRFRKSVGRRAPRVRENGCPPVARQSQTKRVRLNSRAFRVVMARSKSGVARLFPLTSREHAHKVSLWEMISSAF